MSGKLPSDDLVLRFSYQFLAAGGSALLLSMAHMRHELWFLSLFALVPYLWKLKRSCISESLTLAVIFSVSFSFVVFIGDLANNPAIFVLKLSLITMIFIIFGVAINRLIKFIDFYPVFIATLWLPLEYSLIKLIGPGHILDFSDTRSGLLVRFSSVFGLMMISFFIMLVNSVILCLLEFAWIRCGSAGKFYHLCCPVPVLDDSLVVIQKYLFFAMEPRAPPSFSSLGSIIEVS